MHLQYITDSLGKPTGVYIPINEWKKLKKKYKDLEDPTEKENFDKAAFFESLQEAADQVRLHKQGKIQLKTAQELLDEL